MDDFGFAADAASAGQCAPQAFAVAERELYALCRRLLREAQRITGQRAEAEDVVQDCLVRALERGSSQADEMNWQAWLIITVRHRAIDAVRRTRRHTRIQVEQLTAPEPVSEQEAQPLLAHGEAQLRAALQALPEGYGRLIELHYLEQLSYRELAQRLGLSATAVATRLHRARAKLRHALRAVAGD